MHKRELAAAAAAAAASKALADKMKTDPSGNICMKDMLWIFDTSIYAHRCTYK
jgi:hypothetical protein